MDASQSTSANTAAVNVISDADIIETPSSSQIAASPSFVSTASSDPRQFQFGARLSF